MAASPEPWQESDVVVELTTSLAVHTGKVALRDYDPLQPPCCSRARRRVRRRASDTTILASSHRSATESGARRFKSKRTGRARARSRVSGNCRFFVTGHKFDLGDHYRQDANGAYLLTNVQHTARAGDYRTWTSAPMDYRNAFVAVPLKTKFRPARVTPPPIVHGTQTALVVGPGGEDIWVDKYGRVKVQFYWDRLGKKNESSSCWVRVASTWAGKQWGFVQIPRIGQEVVVDFLEGDPDRPIIVGSVYNADQMPPYALPANKTQSGVKSRSSLQGGPGQLQRDPIRGQERQRADRHSRGEGQDRQRGARSE